MPSKQIFTKLTTGAVLLSVLFTIILPTLSPKKAQAQANISGTWINRTTIQVGNDSFTDSNIWDTNYEYAGQVDDKGCVNVIQTANPETNTLNSARFIDRNWGIKDHKYQCIDTSPNENFPLNSADQQLVNAIKVAADAIYVPQSYKVETGQFSDDPKPDGPQYFKKIASGTPGYDNLTADQKNGYFQLQSDGNYYHNRPFDQLTYISMSNEASGKIIFKKDGKTGASGTAKIILQAGGVILKLPKDAPDPPPGVDILGRSDANASGINTDTAPGGKPDATCESNNGTIIIGWLICSVINAIDSGIQTAGDAVNSLLALEASDYSADELHSAWNAFRMIASFSLLAVAMVMIIGQAIGKD